MKKKSGDKKKEERAKALVSLKSPRHRGSADVCVAGSSRWKVNPAEMI
jgi:hypothetical protein